MRTTCGPQPRGHGQRPWHCPAAQAPLRFSILNDSSIPLSVKFMKMDRSSGGGVLTSKFGETGQACTSGWLTGLDEVIEVVTSSNASADGKPSYPQGCL